MLKTTNINKNSFDYIRYCLLIWVVTITIGSLILSGLLAANKWSLEEKAIIGVIQVFLFSFVLGALLSVPALFLFGFGVKWFFSITRNVITFRILAVLLIAMLIFITQWIFTSGRFEFHPFNYSYIIGGLVAVVVIKPE